MKKSELFFNVLLVPIDFLMIFFAGILAYSLRFSSELSHLRPIVFDLPFAKFMEIIFMVSPIFILSFALVGLYSNNGIRKLWKEIFHIMISVSASFMFLIFITFMQRDMFSSRFIFFAGWIFAILTVVFGRVITRFIQGWMVSKFKFGFHRLVLLGDDGAVKTIQNSIKRNSVLGYKIIRKLRDFHLEDLEKINKDSGIDEIILCSSDVSKERIQELLDFCQENNIDFKFVPDMFQAQAALFEMQTISDITLIEVKRTSLDGWGKVAKRAVDIFGSLVGIIFLSPFFVLVALIIKFDSAGPVYVRLERISRGKKFMLFKFRSMIEGAHEMKYDQEGNLKPEFEKLNERGDGPLFKLKNDPRITKVGRFIRKTRLDEFPQLFNVLKGEMSLIGPRPHEPEEIAKYKKSHRKLLTIKPGMTGMAQISGSSDLDFEKEAKLDIYYIENWSLFLDFIILFKTFITMIKGDETAC